MTYCGRPEYHCRWCGKHLVVLTLVASHEARCELRPGVSAA